MLIQAHSEVLAHLMLYSQGCLQEAFPATMYSTSTLGKLQISLSLPPCPCQSQPAVCHIMQPPTCLPAGVHVLYTPPQTGARFP